MALLVLMLDFLFDRELASLWRRRCLRKLLDLFLFFDHQLLLLLLFFGLLFFLFNMGLLLFWKDWHLESHHDWLSWSLVVNLHGRRDRHFFRSNWSWCLSLHLVKDVHLVL